MALSLQNYSYDGKITEILRKRLERQRKLSLGTSIENGDCLPEPLIIEILSWLPVKTCLLFKSVCKLWYSIIKSSHFISKNLKNYYKDDNNWRDCLIVQYCKTQGGELDTFELLVDHKSKKILSYQQLDTPTFNTPMCGPCDGIYLLWEFCVRPHRSLWNPTLQEYKILPECTLKPDLPSYMRLNCEVFGIGFDFKLKDYKVVVIDGYKNKGENYYEIINYPLSLFIYSLKSNSWRYWGDLKNSYYLEQHPSYVFVNNSYYWLGSLREDGYNYEVIISFDFAEETCEEISLPKFDNKPWYGSQLVVYHDSIAFVCVPEKEKKICLWTWNKEVWTRKLIIDVGFEVCGAFCHWRDNMLLFRKRYGKLVLCDTDTNETWELDDPNVGLRYDNIIVYKESLVSIKEFSTEAA